jgi:hypothetical protein
MQFEWPILTDIHVDGQVAARLTLRRDPDGWQGKGRAFWRKGRFQIDRLGVDVDQLDLDLPLWFAASASAAVGEPLQGRLSVARMRLPIIGPSSLNMPLVVVPGEVIINPGPSFRLAEGRLAFGAIRLRHEGYRSMQLRSNLRAQHLSLERLADGFWPSAPSGDVNAALDEIRFTTGSLSADGNVSAHLFGGRIVVENPGISHMLSALPLFSGDVAIQDIDLSLLTADSPFGHVEGVLQGRIGNLEVVNRQPQRFDLLLETVPRKGVRQRISVEAVENIARIGGGQSPFVGLAGGMVGFLREFNYGKIGVRAVLKNDTFRINGTIHDGGQEYLVKKSGLTGVDVVNRDPNMRISFKEMVRKIRSIAASDRPPRIE